jgi:hypothetical protein
VRSLGGAAPAKGEGHEASELDRHRESDACLMPAAQLVEVELEVSSDKGCNNEKKLEGNSHANSN